MTHSLMSRRCSCVAERPLAALHAASSTYVENVAAGLSADAQIVFAALDGAPRRRHHVHLQACTQRS